MHTRASIHTVYVLMCVCAYVVMCVREIVSEREIYSWASLVYVRGCACACVRDKCLLCQVAAFLEKGPHEALDLVWFFRGIFRVEYCQRPPARDGGGEGEGDTDEWFIDLRDTTEGPRTGHTLIFFHVHVTCRAPYKTEGDASLLFFSFVSSSVSDRGATICTALKTKGDASLL